MEGTPDIGDYVVYQNIDSQALRNKVRFEAWLSYALQGPQVGPLPGKLRALPRNEDALR